MPAPTKPRKNYGISRIDQPDKKSHGYYVRVKKVSKFFADGVHGSKRKAYEAAETYRDTLFNDLTAREKTRAAKPRKTPARGPIVNFRGGR